MPKVCHLRLFFALEIAESQRADIQRWCRRTLPAVGRPVAPQNYHITLAFLGDVTDSVAEGLTMDCRRIDFVPFRLELDRTGYFPKSGIYWIGPSRVPGELTALVKGLRKVSRKHRIKTDRRPFQPHLTLFRNCIRRPPAPVEPPGFALDCSGFTLFQSEFAATGVRYHPLRTWE